jgi:hypothetical protein
VAAWFFVQPNRGRKVLSIAAGCGSVVSAGIVFLSGELEFWGINLLGAAWEFFAFPLYSLAVAHANVYAEPSDYIMVSNGLLLVFGSGAILGPFAGSVIMAMTNLALRRFLLAFDAW